MEAQNAAAAEYDDEARLGQEGRDSLGRLLLRDHSSDSDSDSDVGVRKPLLPPGRDLQERVGTSSSHERNVHQPWNRSKETSILPWYKRPSVSSFLSRMHNRLTR